MKGLFARCICSLVVLGSTTTALSQTPKLITTTKPAKASLLLASAGVTGNEILLAGDEWWGVGRAAQDLANDLSKVTGTKNSVQLAYWDNRTIHHFPFEQPQQGHEAVKVEVDGKLTMLYDYKPVTSFVDYTTGPQQFIAGPTLLPSTPARTVIIAGTLSHSALITHLIDTSKIDASAIVGKWEAYLSVVVHNPLPGIEKALVIVGSDLRGTVFGLYRVSEEAGVSPWWWWSDVPIKKADGIWVEGAEGEAAGEVRVQKSPSVKYRGIFLNDEQPALTNWVNANYPPSPYGPGFTHGFYATVFELLLRLKANYLWPAEWASMFAVDDVKSQALADAYGVVMGTSHTEPMMRASNEWGTFGKDYGGNGEWEYDTNNASLSKFFTYGAQRAAPYVGNSLFTMAMRGSGDTAILLSQAEAIAVLENVVKEQRKILGEVFKSAGGESKVEQMWCLYKEVQGYYEAGMNVPEDITLLWSDDNWGNLRRVPIGDESQRSGGAGIYYHVDYVGSPRSYKWINTIQLSKTVHQMQLAAAYNASRIWMLNVGDLKALEIPMNHFLDLAYDTPAWSYDSVPRWLSSWATREFGGAVAEEVASIMERYGMLAARRKYELLAANTYSVLNYGEADGVLQEWEVLAADAQKVYDGLGEQWKASFFEMVLQPALGGHTLMKIYVGAAKNALYAGQRRTSTDVTAKDVSTAFGQDAALTKQYHELLDGKWNHMLDQTHIGYDNWQQPMRNTPPPLIYTKSLERSLAGSLGVGVEGSNASVPGDDMYHPLSTNTLTLPPLSPYGARTRYIDMFTRGPESCDWTITPSEPYVIATPSSGSTSSSKLDSRVVLTVDWSRAPAPPKFSTVTLAIKSSCAWGNYDAPSVLLPLHHTAAPASFAGFVESDRHLSLEASHFTAAPELSGFSYTILPSYGRTLAGVTLVPVTAPSLTPKSGPQLSYSIYTFTPTPLANITLYLSPSLNFLGPKRPLRYAVAIDDETPQVRQFVADATGANMPAGWEGAVSDAVWGVSSGRSTTTEHAGLAVAGEHVLRIWLLEPGVVVQKIVVDLGGVRSSYLGPPESFRAVKN